MHCNDDHQVGRAADRRFPRRTLLKAAPAAALGIAALGRAAASPSDQPCPEAAVQELYEFVLTGRHMTLRCDGGPAAAMPFGGPIVYGHAASGETEKPGHPGNVFWPQGVAANELFQQLDGRQQARALLKQAPPEKAVGFRGPRGDFPGLAIAAMTDAQKQLAQRLLEKLIEPYRQADRQRVLACLKSQGGLDKCHLSFYEEPRLASDRVWDIWRLEGPAFVWHFRGAPHVHVWVHVGDDPSVPLNA
jgi:hypothetical protein